MIPQVYTPVNHRSWSLSTVGDRTVPTLSFFGQAKQADELLKAELALPGQSELSTEQVKELVRFISLGYLQELMADKETFQARFGAPIEDIYPEFFDTALSSLTGIAQSALATLGLAEDIARDKGILQGINAASALALPKSNIVDAAYAVLNPLSKAIAINSGVTQLIQQTTSINASVLDVARWLEPITIDVGWSFNSLDTIAQSVSFGILIPKYDWIGDFERWQSEDDEIMAALGLTKDSEEYQEYYGEMSMPMIRRAAEVAKRIRSWLENPKNEPEKLTSLSSSIHDEVWEAIQGHLLHMSTIFRLQTEYAQYRKQSKPRVGRPKGKVPLSEQDIKAVLRVEDMVKKGLPIETAVQYGRMSRATFFRWRGKLSESQ